MKPNHRDIDDRVPYFDETLDIQDDGEYRCQVARMLYSLRQWSNESIDYEIFTAGKTNKIFCCYQRDNPADKVVFRVYGPKTELLVDRVQELRSWHRLYNIGCAAPIYATFANGIVCGHLPGVTLTYETVTDRHIAREIARTMAKVHSIVPDDGDTTRPSQLFIKLREYIGNLPENLSNADNNVRFVRQFADRSRLLADADRLEAAIAKLHARVVFCHNDLLLHNILYDKVTDSINFIDYEYADFNYQAFDIGNHFCEYAGMDNWDFSRYPDRDYQLIWIADYLNFYEPNETKSIDHVEMLYQQVNVCASISHFIWSLWALIQSEYSSIDFDFFSYGMDRYDAYINLRDRFVIHTAESNKIDDHN